MKKQISKATLGFRHLIIKVISPTVYKHIKTCDPLPRGVVQVIKKKFSNKPLMGVEIGVAEGIHAESILKTLNIQKLYLIDPYKSFLHYSTKQVMQLFLNATRRLNPYRNKIVWIKKRSEEAVDDVPNGLDFVYIDGNHDFEYVKKDIELYYPKIRDEGVLGGHDFSMDLEGWSKQLLIL